MKFKTILAIIFTLVIYSCDKLDNNSGNNTECCPDDQHIHAIDLGLSVKWGCCNLGATTPEGIGGYYAWGCTSQQSEYTRFSYPYVSINHIDDYLYGDFKPIPSNIAGTSYDAASASLGNGWHLPSKEQFSELFSECTVVKQSNGIQFIGKNGNSILLPYNGRYVKSSIIVEDKCIYWTSDASSETISAYYVDDNCFWTGYYYAYGLWDDTITTLDRWIGQGIRPVKD